MSASEPGTVAVATVRGVPNVRVMRYKEGASGDWFSDSQIHGAYYSHLDSEVTDVRPLVVLDHAAWMPEYVARIPAWLREVADAAPSESLIHHLADQIEAQTKPPRIPEPGWGEKVIASTKGRERREFVNAYAYQGTTDGVWTDAAGYHGAWTDLIDPVLIREGVES